MVDNYIYIYNIFFSALRAVLENKFDIRRPFETFNVNILLLLFHKLILEFRNGRNIQKSPFNDLTVYRIVMWGILLILKY